MPLDYRLKKEKDFELVFKKGKRVFSRSLTMIYLPANSTKVGFCVSKKHGKSVQRNRIKRLLRESFRSFFPNFGENFFFVFIPKVNDMYSVEQFKKDMAFMLEKNQLIKKDA